MAFLGKGFFVVGGCVAANADDLKLAMAKFIRFMNSIVLCWLSHLTLSTNLSLETAN
jgi:hypothetical protein